MSVPDYPFNFLLADPAYYLPIPDVNQPRSLDLDSSSKDQFLDEEGAVPKHSINETFLPPEGRLSSAAFVNNIRKRLLMEKNKEEQGHLSSIYFANASIELSSIKLLIQEYLSKWITIEKEALDLSLKVNGQFQLYNKIKNASTVQMDYFNQLILQFNAKIEELNKKIEVLNLQFSSLGFDRIQKIKSLKDCVKDKKQGKLLKRQLPNVAEILKKYYEPLQNITVGFMVDLNQLLNVKKEVFVFQKMTSKLRESLFEFQSEKFLEYYMELLSSQSEEGFSLVKAVSLSTIEKILASATIRAAMLETKIALTELEIKEVQLLILNILSKASLQSASNPSFQLLGNDWGKIGISDEHISFIHAITFNQTLLAIVEKGVVEESIGALIQSKDRMASFPEKDKLLLIQKLTSIVNLALLQNGLIQAAISVNFVPLIGKVLQDSLSHVKIPQSKLSLTFNDVLTDKSIRAYLEANSINQLILNGLTKEKAFAIVTKSFGACENILFYRIQDVFELLTLQFQLNGLTQALSEKLGLSAIDLLLKISPCAALEDRKMYAELTFSLIDKEDLLSDSVLDAILKNFDAKSYKTALKKGIEELYEKASLEKLFSTLLTNKLLNDICEDNAPITVKDHFIYLFRSLTRQGMDVEEAVGIAETALRYVMKANFALKAFIKKPTKLKVFLDTFIQLFTEQGLSLLEAETLAKKLTQYFVQEKESLDVGIYKKMIEELINDVLLAKKSLIETAFATQKIKKCNVKEVFKKPASFFGDISLLSALDNHLKKQGYLEGLAEKILHSPLKDSNLRPIASMSDHFTQGSLGAGLISCDVSKYLIKKEALQRGLNEKNASRVAEIISPHLHLFHLTSKKTDYSDDHTKKIQFSEELHKCLTRDSDDYKHFTLMVKNQLSKRYAIEETVMEGLDSLLIQAIKETTQKLDATRDETTFKQLLCHKLSDLVVDQELFQKIDSIIENMNLPRFLVRELVLSQLVLLSLKTKSLDIDEIKKIRFIGDQFFRKILFLTKEMQKDLLKEFLLDSTIFKEKEVLHLIENFSFDLIDREDSITDDFMEAITEKIEKKLKEILTPEKANKLASLFKSVICDVSSPSIQTGIEKQIEILVNQVKTKYHKRLVLQGVLDSMQSAMQVNFDVFIFNQILNSNGKMFLKLIQEALLNEIGVNESLYTQTIDLLI